MILIIFIFAVSGISWYGLCGYLIAHALSVNIMTILLYEARARNANLKIPAINKKVPCKQHCVWDQKDIWGGVLKQRCYIDPQFPEGNLVEEALTSMAFHTFEFIRLI